MKKIEKFYHDNGNVKIEYEINEFGEKDGFYKEFHENGQLKVEVTFFNGKQNLGTILSYHDNGSKSGFSHLFYGIIAGGRWAVS